MGLTAEYKKKTDIKIKYGRKLRLPIEDKVYYGIIYFFILILLIIIVLPIIFIIASSFSSGRAVSSSQVLLWPVEPTLDGYITVFSYKLFLTGFRNTVFYTVAGTIIQVFMMMICAYPLSRKELPFRRFFLVLFIITMYFNGGLIPTYLLMCRIGFYNRIWIMIIPGAVSVYRMIIARTFIKSTIPEEILQSAQIDGCSDARYFFSILLPLSKTVMIVSALFFAVGHWNAYFSALIYISDRKLYPLQLVLRNILQSADINLVEVTDPDVIEGKQGMVDLLKYSLIVVSSAPIVALYPFVQKHFVKGIMLGSLKG